MQGLGGNCSKMPRKGEGMAVHKMLQIVKKDSQNYSEGCSKVAQKLLQNLFFFFHIYYKKLLITQPKNHFSLFLDS